jgi:hypothetical protein
MQICSDLSNHFTYLYSFWLQSNYLKIENFGQIIMTKKKMLEKCC